MILFAEAERWTDKELERVRKLSQVSSVRHCQYLFTCSWQKLVFQTTTVSCQPGEKCGYCREPELLKHVGLEAVGIGVNHVHCSNARFVWNNSCITDIFSLCKCLVVCWVLLSRFICCQL